MLDATGVKAPSATLVEGDVSDLPLAMDSFDVALAVPVAGDERGGVEQHVPAVRVLLLNPR
jgi:hypothetical protein